MSKKSSRQKKTRTHNQAERTYTGPLGLRLVIQALGEADNTGRAGAYIAGQYQGVPDRILKGLHDERSIESVLEEVTNEIYPDGALDGQPANECPSHSRDVAFWSGVATCWYVMTVMQSKDGAR